MSFGRPRFSYNQLKATQNPLRIVDVATSHSRGDGMPLRSVRSVSGRAGPFPELTNYTDAARFGPADKSIRNSIVVNVPRGDRCSYSSRRARARQGYQQVEIAVRLSCYSVVPWLVYYTCNNRTSLSLDICLLNNIQRLQLLCAPL